MLRKRMVLGELEVKVLNVLWERGPSTVREVVEALPDEDERHYNTCSTVLSRLGKRGLVAREREGRGYRYEARIGREELGRQYLKTLSNDLFGGSLAKTLATLLQPGKIGRRRMRRLERMIAEIEREEDA